MIREDQMEEKQIGAVDHFFDKISVAMIRLTDPLKVGDSVRIKSKASELTQAVSSMHIDRVPAQEAKAGDLISVKVDQRVSKGDPVYKAS
jgi:translation elongation factor EF-1alpha